MIRRRADGLFARLLIAMLVLAISLLGLFGALFYVERNVAVARLVAERWTPALRQGAGWQPPSATPALVLHRSQATPAGARQVPPMPRLTALRESYGCQAFMRLSGDDPLSTPNLTVSQA